MKETGQVANTLIVFDNDILFSIKTIYQVPKDTC